MAVSSVVTDVLDPVQLREGGTLPVSKFSPGGVVQLGMTQWAKRGVAPKIPVVDMDKCTQCNKCASICPHAVIRPFLASPAELKEAPEAFDARRAGTPTRACTSASRSAPWTAPAARSA